MIDTESDILIAEAEEEVDTESPVLENSHDDLFEEKRDDTNLFEPTLLKQEENKVIKKETDAFVNYNYNNLNKVYKQYDVVETYVPKKKQKKEKEKEFEKFVTEQDSYTPERETVLVEKVQHKQKFQLKSKAKAWLVSITIIIAMLGGLAIYNAVHISDLTNQANQTEITIGNVKKDIDAVVKNTNELTDLNSIENRADELGLEQATDDDKITITLNEKNELETYESQTNFFDKICNFFRNLFGG